MQDKPATMTKREMNLRVFRGEDIPEVFLQPRIEPWHAWHTEVGTLPKRYSGMSVRDLFDDLDVSMRYVHYYTGMPEPVVRVRAGEVTVTVQRPSEGRKTRIIHTPHGQLVEEQHLTVDKTWRTVDFPVKGRGDLTKLKWLLERTQVVFDADNFEEGSRYVGDRGEPQFWVPKSPYQSLCQQWMKLDDFIYALADAPEEIEEVMRLIDRSYEPLYERLISYGGVKIVNFGENIHQALLSPTYFERYLIPWYEKRSGRLRDAGIFTHVHIDGYFKSLLKYLPDLPFDGYEALTPLPQGDVSLQEIKDHVADKVLLDGIPAILFLPHHSLAELQECVARVVGLFHPRLVLGISDELPEGVGESGIERLRWVRQYCRAKPG